MVLRKQVSPLAMATQAHWAVVALVLLLLAGSGCRGSKQTPVAAFLLPHGPEVKLREGWRSRPLRAPATAYEGDSFTIPAGGVMSVLRIDGSVERITGPADLRIEAGPGSPLEFLSGTVADAARTVTAPAQPAEQSIRVTSPVGVTRFLKPTLTWAAEPNTLYDVAIIDPADPASPPRLLKTTTPPVAFDALEAPLKRALPPDRILMVLIRESARPDRVGTSRFLTAADASTGDVPEAPHELVAEIVHALREPPRRTGDAWLALHKLPAAWRASELGQRFQRLLAAELGLPNPLTQGKDSPTPTPTPE